MTIRNRELACLLVTTICLFLALPDTSHSQTPERSAAGVQSHPKFPDGTAMSRISRAGKVRVGTRFDVPLFSLKHLDGTMSGFDVETAKIIASALGIQPDKIEWVETQSTQREKYLEQGKVDFIVSQYTMTPLRQEVVTFAGPNYLAQERILVRAETSNIVGPTSFTQNANLKLCSVSGAKSATDAKSYLANWHDQLVLFDARSKCVAALKNKQVDALVADTSQIAGVMYQNKGAFKIVGPAIADENNAIGIPKGELAFCHFINDSLAKAVQNGDYAQAWKRTIGEVEPKVAPLPKPVPCA